MVTTEGRAENLIVLRQRYPHLETHLLVRFQQKNPDFLIRNPDLLIRNLDFRLKTVDLVIKQDMESPAVEVIFQWKNPDFLFRNPDFLFKNLDFLIKNLHFTICIQFSSAFEVVYCYGLLYCELKYKSQVVFEFSVENAEIMENCP